MSEPDGWDVWVITPHRNADTISRFLAGFVDRAAAEDRGDEQLMLNPLVERASVDIATSPSTTTEEIAGWVNEFDWEPALTLTHSIERGLSRPWRAFSLFGLPSTRRDLMSAAIEFTSDGELVLGVEASTSEEAAAWLERLADEFDADLGLVSIYVPGSRERAEELIATGKAHHHWRRKPAAGTEITSRPRIS
jgi:hypothetical protein